MGQLAVMAKLYDLPRDDMRPTRRQLVSTTLRALPALLAPALLIGGLLSGYFGPTEVAGVTVAYALFIGVAIYRTLTLRTIRDALIETAEATAGILFIVAAAAVLGFDARPGAREGGGADAERVEQSDRSASARQPAPAGGRHVSGAEIS